MGNEEVVEVDDGEDEEDDGEEADGEEADSDESEDRAQTSSEEDESMGVVSEIKITVKLNRILAWGVSIFIAFCIAWMWLVVMLLKQK